MAVVEVAKEAVVKDHKVEQQLELPDLDKQVTKLLKPSQYE